MSFGTLCLSLTIFWLAIHALSTLFPNHTTLLPTTAPRLRASSTHITVKHLHLRIQTTTWNSIHDQLATRLASKPFRRVRKALNGFYDIGSVVGVLGMVVGVGVLIWTLGELGVGVLGKLSAQEGQVGGIVKRALESSRIIQTERTTSLLNPIVPGVTVPLTHLPLIFLSVFICQIIHEAGHALSAALEQIPLLSTGLSLTLILPSAFVIFPTSFPNPSSASPSSADALRDRSRQRARARMRVVAGGAWHNLVFWGILVAVAGVSKGWIWGLVGYDDVSRSGKVVLGIDEDSPLRDHLPLGVLITQLDDVSLHATSRFGQESDKWTSYLTGTYRLTAEDREAGWCVDSAWWIDKPTACCDHPPKITTDAGNENSQSSRLSCFSSLSSAHRQTAARCLDPIPLFTNSHPKANPNDGDGSETGKSHAPAPAQTLKRCSVSNPCPADSECVGLRKGERILRITFEAGEYGRKEVLLWSGPKVEVWDQVEVGNLRPRFQFLPLSLPSIVGIFFEYLQMATLSLYLFNLLPLPFLDGTQLLDAILDFVFDCYFFATSGAPEEIDLEALEGGVSHVASRRGRSGHGRWKRWVAKMVRSGTTGLCVGCVGLGVINWMVVR